MVIRGVDIGRSIVKDYDGKAIYCFPSYVGEARTLKNDRELMEHDNAITFHLSENEEVNFFTGQIAYEESEYATKFMSVSKVHNDTRILAIASIARRAENDESVFAMLSQPIDNQTDTEKTALKQLILGKYDVTINGERKQFSIDRVEVGAEGVVSVFALENVPSGYHHIIDLGSTTFNIATFKGKKWIDKESCTEYVGVETMRNYSPSNISRLIASKFFQVVRRQKGNVTLIGGKAKEISENMSQYFKNIEVPKNHTTIGAVGLYELGKLLQVEVK